MPLAHRRRRSAPRARRWWLVSRRAGCKPSELSPATPADPPDLLGQVREEDRRFYTGRILRDHQWPLPLFWCRAWAIGLTQFLDASDAVVRRRRDLDRNCWTPVVGVTAGEAVVSLRKPWRHGGEDYDHHVAELEPAVLVARVALSVHQISERDLRVVNNQPSWWPRGVDVESEITTAWVDPRDLDPVTAAARDMLVETKRNFPPRARVRRGSL